jgi:hypothetical protein
MRARHVSIVIAGNRGHAVGRAERLQPDAGAQELRAHSDIGEVPGHGDMVRPLRAKIVDQAVEALAGQHGGAAAAPVGVADHPLGEQIPQP